MNRVVSKIERKNEHSQERSNKPERGGSVDKRKEALPNQREKVAG